MSKEERNGSIGIVTFPVYKTGNTPLTNLVSILSSIYSDIHIVTGNEVDITSVADSGTHIYKIEHRTGANLITRIVRYVYTQLKISYKVLKLSREVQTWIFFIGGEVLLLPIMTAKCLRKNVVMKIAGSTIMVTQAQKDPYYKAVWLLCNINHTLSNRIIVYTNRLIEEYDLKRHRNKISIAHHHFLDFNKFKTQKALIERSNLVGYIGRLDRNKGVLNLLEAIQKLVETKGDINFLIAGEGELRSEVEEFSKREDLNGRVRFVDWVNRDSLPDYLNELKLLILPSYSEGLPSIILEAMACSTPVLATPVGGVPDVIEDGKTGFIMEDNSSKCITGSIVMALNHPDIDEIARNACDFVNSEYTYEAAVNSYRYILGDLK